MIENIHSICINTAYACAAGVGAAVVAYIVACGAKLVSGGVKCVTAGALVGSLIIGGMVVTNTRYAAAKTNDTQQVGGGLSCTNDVGQVEGGTNVLKGVVQGRARSPSAPQGMANGESNGPALRRVRGTRPTGTSPITDEDIANQWRVVSVSSNAPTASTFTMPLHATVWESAQRRGAVYGAWNIPLKDWNFPFDDHGWSNVFVRCEGVLRDSFRDASDQIRFLAPFALCPAANWARYNLSASRAWCATNELGGLTVAVENGAIGNDAAKIASARLDLDPSLGEIRLRYDLAQIGDATFDVGPTVNGTNTFVMVGSNTSEVVFRRIHPEDWDYDGLPNDLDPNPRVPDSGAGWNQSDIWGQLVYPSNATEIATLGYTAWMTNRVTEPNRRLVGLTVASAKGDWPVRLTRGNVPVLCDGREELRFALDCGAKYAIACESGKFASIAAYGTNETDVTTVCIDISEWSYPYDFSVGDFTVHLDTPNRGWICCSADVEISLDGREVGDFGQYDDAGGIFGHFTSGSPHVLMGELHNCHSNAFIDCTWSGGPGFSFADPHSLATEVTWTATDDTAWATNFITLVTCYEGGYSLTNTLMACVGPEHVPPTGFDISCQDILFLNDDHRLERVYPVTVTLEGTNGLSGAVTLECSGADSKLALDPYMDAPTNRLEFTMSIEEDDWFTSGRTVYLSCATVGVGQVSAAIAFTNGTSCATSTTFRVIEPLRKLVATEEYRGRIVNPSRLVWGTNAVLKVGMNGELDRTNVVWNVVEGPGRILRSDGFVAEVEATNSIGTVTVEARFNQDEIQPRFVLPVVQRRTIPLRAFLVRPPKNLSDDAWKESDVREMVDIANVVHAQVGVYFDLLSVSNNVGEAGQYWDVIVYTNEAHNVFGEQLEIEDYTPQFENLTKTYNGGDCIELYLVGSMSFLPNYEGSGEFALCDHGGVFIPRGINTTTLAHELGHSFVLEDIYADIVRTNKISFAHIDISAMRNPVRADVFGDRACDWGRETGRGFYEKSDTIGTIINQLLMFGIDFADSDVKGDIPSYTVWGMPAEVKSAEGTRQVRIGEKNMNKNDNVVFSK